MGTRLRDVSRIRLVQLPLLLLLCTLPAWAQTPAWDSCGTQYGSDTVPATHNVVAPATINAGDVLTYHVVLRNGDSDVSVTTPPSGFTLIGINGTPGANNLVIWAWWKLAVGDEDGANISVATAGGTNQDRIGAVICRWTASGGFAANPIADTDTSPVSADSPIVGPSMTATGVNQLAVYFVGVNANPTDIAALGAVTGGTWVERQDFGGGSPGARVHIQDASLAGGGSISGGSEAYTSTPDNNRGIGFVLASAEQRQSIIGPF